MNPTTEKPMRLARACAAQQQMDAALAVLEGEA